MSFSEIIGQERAVKILTNIVKNNKIAHSYIFAGPSSSGKSKAALEFAKFLNCESPLADTGCDNCRSCKKINNGTHPEINLYLREKANISIDLIRDIQKTLQFSKTEAKYRFVIIEDADKMTKEANNSFLKTLEEPPDSCIIILLTSSASTLIKTILSRCQIIRFKKLTFDEKMQIIKAKSDFADKDIKNSLSLTSNNLSETILNLEDNDTFSDNIERFSKIYDHFMQNDFSSLLQSEFESLAKDKENFSAFLTFFLNKVELENFEISENKKKIESFLQAKKYFRSNVSPRLIWAWLYFENQS